MKKTAKRKSIKKKVSSTPVKKVIQKSVVEIIKEQALQFFRPGCKTNFYHKMATALFDILFAIILVGILVWYQGIFMELAEPLQHVDVASFVPEIEGNVMDNFEVSPDMINAMESMKAFVYGVISYGVLALFFALLSLALMRWLTWTSVVDGMLKKSKAKISDMIGLFKRLKISWKNIFKSLGLTFLDFLVFLPLIFYPLYMVTRYMGQLDVGQFGTGNFNLPSGLIFHLVLITLFSILYLHINAVSNYALMKDGKMMRSFLKGFSQGIGKIHLFIVPILMSVLFMYVFMTLLGWLIEYLLPGNTLVLVLAVLPITYIRYYHTRIIDDI